MASEFLRSILEHKQNEVALLRKSRNRFHARDSEPRPFAAALRSSAGISVIAEVKKASPSKGLIRPDFNPTVIAESYEKGGASAVSVLTDSRFFQGSTDFLVAVREHVGIPVLRKDFIIDPLQVEEAATINADALLLIAAALSDGQMAELFEAASENAIEALIEIHAPKELDRVMKLSPRLLGINNRDLTSFEVDIAVTERIAPHVPDDVTLISESGIFNAQDIVRVKKAGVHGVLVGESLMRAEDPSRLIEEFRSAGKD